MAENKTQPKVEFITGTIAGGLTPKNAPRKEQNPEEELLAELGEAKPRPVPVLDSKTAKAMAKMGPTPEEELMSSLNGPSIALKGDDPQHHLESPVVKSDKGFSSLGKAALITLSIEEHLEVKALSKLQGLPEKKDISEYTWGNYLRENGLPDSVGTDALGFALGVGLSPSTYLSFGTTGVTKL